ERCETEPGESVGGIACDACTPFGTHGANAVTLDCTLRVAPHGHSSFATLLHEHEGGCSGKSQSAHATFIWFGLRAGKRALSFRAKARRAGVEESQSSR